MKKIDIKFIITIFYIFNSGLALSFEFTQDCSAPESVYYDSVSKNIFVSNIVGDGTKKDGIGHIAKLSSNGKVLNSKWVKGLNAPKGMRSYKEELWVTDIDRVLKINIKTGQIITIFKIPGAKFLNDIAINKNGLVYISDTLTSSIYKIENEKVSLLVKGAKYQSPNGLLILGDKLIVAAWGLTTDWSTKVLGHLYSLDLKTLKIKLITSTPLGNLDGLEIDKKGDFLVSDWVTGKVYKVSKQGKVSVIFKGVKGLADISYISYQNMILAPLMLSNKVIQINL